jgi:outer membrane protein
MFVRHGILQAAAAVVVALGTGALGAQATPAAPTGAPPRVITFEEALRIALQQNATVRQARNATELNAAAVREARLSFLPDLRLNTQGAQTYGRNFNENEGQIVDQTTQSLNAGVSSSVTVFNGFANVANLREARLAENAGELDLTRTRQTVVFTVASNFLTLVQQQEQLRVRRENLTAEQALEQQIQAYVDAGVRTIADLYQQQAAVASARLAVVEGERAASLAEVDVMQTLQLDPRGTYAFAAPALDSVPPTDTVRYDLDALLARALTQRVDIDAEEARQDAADQAIRAARASYWPSISLGLGYNTGYSSASDFAFTDQLDQRRGGSLTLGLSIPLFDRGSTQLATQRAEIQADNARLALETARQQAGLEVRRAYLDFQSARAQLVAAEAQLRAAELALQASFERYQAGASTLVELTQARATRVQAASALINARYNARFQRTVMDYYVGDLDPERVSID